MVDGIRVAVLTRGDPEFYRLLGPVLGRRRVAEELGSPPWDDDGKTWWVAVAGEGVAGFCAASEAGRHVQFGSAYVVPEFRGRGVYGLLAEERDRACAGWEVRVVCRRELVPVFERRGFAVVGGTGRFARMVRPAGRGGSTHPKKFAHDVANLSGAVQDGPTGPTEETTMTITMVAMTNEHPDFYRLLGPFLARREVHKAVGAPVYDEDGKVWIIAMDDKEVAGFLGLETRKGSVAIKSCYLVPGYEALRADLVQAAIERTAPSPLVANVHEDNAAIYTDRFGFNVVGHKGRWVSLARAAGEPAA